MAWEIDRYGVARYVQKVRIDGRVTSKVLGVGEDGLAAEKQVLFEREESKNENSAPILASINRPSGR
jgi:hypothetical protein